jgi:hypothetical protein
MAGKRRTGSFRSAVDFLTFEASVERRATISALADPAAIVASRETLRLNFRSRCGPYWRLSGGAGTAMQDMEAHLEKLLNDAEECALISKLATDMAKRELFARLSEHLKTLAGEVERAIKERKAAG